MSHALVLNVPGLYMMLCMLGRENIMVKKLMQTV